MKKGLFIAFEGIDGCGKTTQMKMAARYLFDRSKYEHVILTREPYENRDIRSILAEDANPYARAEKLAEMFIQDRKRHISEMISPSLEKGWHVVSDRYWMSTLAYQSSQGIDLQKLIEMHGIIPIPDITFLVDTPVEIALERIKGDGGRNYEQKFEQRGFMEKLRGIYLELPKKLKNAEIAVIDGSGSIQDIFEKQIRPQIDRAYDARKE